jgi:hypothetical protein
LRDVFRRQRRDARLPEEIVPTPAAQLVRDYGRGFAEKNLRRMV